MEKGMWSEERLAFWNMVCSIIAAIFAVIAVICKYAQ
jgi:uncharacterized membrane protein